MKVIQFNITEGLQQDLFQTYTCLHDEDAGFFFVHIDKNSIKGFKQTTFTNVIKLAEMKKVAKVYFVVSRENPDKSEYRKSFKLIDLKRVTSDEKKAIFKPDTDCLIYSREFN